MHHNSASFRRGGPAALFGLLVDGPSAAAITMTVRHRDLGDDVWSVAGSVTVLGPAESCFKVSDLKEELIVTVAAGLGSPPATVLVAPPRWLTQ